MTSLDQGAPQQPKAPELSPFNVEKIGAVSIPSVEFKDNQLVIDGVPQTQYTNVHEEGHTRRQRNNPDLFYFSATEERSDKKRGSLIARVVDVNHPETVLLTISHPDKERGDDAVIVNGVEWNSLHGKSDIYSGGYHVEVDSEGKKVVFYQHGHNQNNAVIVNDREWNNKFTSIQSATSRFGTVYVVGSKKGGNFNSELLVVDDKEWFFTKSLSPKGQVDTTTSVEKAIAGKNGLVVALVQSHTGVLLTRVLIGDKVGAQKEWKNTLSQGWDATMIVDDENGSVAVFGSLEDGKRGLILDDVKYPLPDNPDKLEYFKFQDGGIVIQYTNALGEKVTEKISLHEDAKEMQEQIEQQQAVEKGLAELRRLLSERGMSPADAVAFLARGDKLEGENKNLKAGLDRSEKDMAEFRLRVKVNETEATTALQREKKIRESAETRANRAEQLLGYVKSILSAAGKTTLGDNYKISGLDKKKVLDGIDALSGGSKK